MSVGSCCKIGYGNTFHKAQAARNNNLIITLDQRSVVHCQHYGINEYECFSELLLCIADSHL